MIVNPLCKGLLNRSTSAFEAIRRAYLDDLVYKPGWSIRKSLSIFPSPEVLNPGFQRIVINYSGIEAPGQCMLLDVGGVTTDLHYTIDIIREDSEEQALPGDVSSPLMYLQILVCNSLI